MQRLQVCKISCELHDSLQPMLVRSLARLGIREYVVQSGRSVQLSHAGGLRHLFGAGDRLRENPMAVTCLYVMPNQETAILQAIAMDCGLSLPGRGSLYSCITDLICPSVMAETIQAGIIPAEKTAQIPAVPMLSKLMGISCIVQRGSGNGVAQAALGLGTCVPSIGFGEGTGLRDKLGLLRVTIPAAKELVHLVVPDHDAQGVMAALIEEAKLNQPGKGFISTYPIRHAILNTSIHIGKQHHAASMEQIIGAVDSLQGNTLWRKRFDHSGASGSTRFPFTKDMVDLICINDEGTASELTRAAMGAGARGATTTRLIYHSEEPAASLPGDPSKERTTMVIEKHIVDAVVDTLLDTGLGGSLTGGYIELHRSPLSFTYRHRT